VAEPLLDQADRVPRPLPGIEGVEGALHDERLDEGADIVVDAPGDALVPDHAPPAADAVNLTLWERERRWKVPGRVVRVEDPSGSAGRRQFAVAFDEPLADACLRHSVLYVSRRRPELGGPA
jgi:hypothetical protein